MRGIGYLRVDMDSWDMALTLAGLLRGVWNRFESHGRLLALWKWGVAQTPNDAPITGIFEDEDPPELISAALEYPGDALKLWSAFLRAGTIADLGETADGRMKRFKIRGLTRYELLREKLRSDAERKRLKRIERTSAGNPLDVRKKSAGRPAVEKRREEKRRKEVLPPPPASQSSSNGPSASIHRLPTRPPILEEEVKEEITQPPPPATAPSADLEHGRPADISRTSVDDSDLEPEEPPLTLQEAISFWDDARIAHGLEPEQLTAPTRKKLADYLPIYSPDQWVTCIAEYLEPKRSKGATFAANNWPMAALLTPGVLGLRMPSREPRKRLCCVCKSPEGDRCPAPRPVCERHFNGPMGWYAAKLKGTPFETWLASWLSEAAHA